MNPEQVAAALSAGLFVGMVVCLEVGYRLGRRSSENPELTHEGIGAIEAAVFALLGPVGYQQTFASDVHVDEILRQVQHIGPIGRFQHEAF